MASKNERGVKRGWGDENKLFSSFLLQYLVNGARYVQSYYYHASNSAIWQTVFALQIICIIREYWRSCICVFDWHHDRWHWM